MKNKLIFIIITLVIVALAIIGWLIWRQGNSQSTNIPSGSVSTGSLHRPEFMTAQEKAKFDLAGDSRVQVISRDEEGQISVYKIIRSEEDVVTDPSKLPPISPSGE
ncbi:MAG: hypothetical protein IT440_16495 [Phycisphaeraceae bacterium]|nr:hypothetical protein [Phycisphaeraceae bacterium]